MIWLCQVLLFSAFTTLCLSNERHYVQVLDGKGTPTQRLILRLFGWLLLVAAIAPSVFELGFSVGLAVWAGMLSVAASLLMLLLTYEPRLIVPLALGTPSLMFTFWLF